MMLQQAADRDRRPRVWRALIIGVAALGLSTLALSSPALAANATGCEGGAFRITGLADGSTVVATPAGGDLATSIAANRLGTEFLVKGTYVEFTVVAASFGVRNWTFTGAPNALDLTGGRRTGVFASKTPDHRGLTLTSAVDVKLSGNSLVIERTGPGLSMKIQALDCATGGIFQMEPGRADGTATRITHTLWSDPGNPDLTAFYFDNPNFRAREGDVVPFKNTTVTVTPRVNFANDFSPKFVGRDSPQVATRIPQGCPNQIQKRDGTFVTVDHCGGVSLWSVASGGRMGQVMGEDATEVAPPATACVQNCQAQDQVRGQAVVLGFPFPVPDSSRLKPRFP
jgi:hypothetical protein